MCARLNHRLTTKASGLAKTICMGRMTCDTLDHLFGCTDQPFTFMTAFELWYWTCVKNCPDETNSPKSRLKTNINRAFELIRNQVHRTFNSSVAEPTFNCSSLFCSCALWTYNHNNFSSPALPVNFTTRLLCVCFSFAIYSIWASLVRSWILRFFKDVSTSDFYVTVHNYLIFQTLATNVPFNHNSLIKAAFFLLC